MLRENILFLRKTLTWQRFRNALLIYLSYFLSLILKKPLLWGEPAVVMIEPTNLCNLKCPLCPSGNNTLERPRGFMDLNLYKQMIDQIYRKAFMVVLWNQGEPFLHPYIYDMIEYASRKRLFTLVSTNANVEFDPERMIRSGLDSMIISLDGATQETYNRYRVNGELRKVLNNLHKLQQVKQRRGSRQPLIRWQFLVMRHNEQEIPQIRKLARDYRVDDLELKTVQIYSKEDVSRFLPRNPHYRRYKIKGDDFELKVGIRNRCRRIWTNLVINWDGEVSVCCFDKNTTLKVGRFPGETLRNIWHSREFQQVRKQILTAREKIPVCRNCGESVKLRFISRI